MTAPRPDLAGFTIDVFQNEFLPAGGRNVNAIVTVTSGLHSATLASPAAAAAAEVIIVDCSGSMNDPAGKMAEAKAATAAAIDAIRDGVSFAVIAGNEKARPVYPADASLALASPQTREAARQAVRGLQADGGTAIGQWLLLAHQIFTSGGRDGDGPAPVRHAILLTDGKNQHETPEKLAGAISWCEGTYRCDCRGVGTDWEVAELRKVSTALLGTVDIVADPAGLAADFTALMRAAMSKEISDVSLRVWTPQHARIKYLKQVAPAVDDLTGRRAAVGAQSGDYPAGAWGPGESRDYHLCVEVSPAGVGQEMLAARVSLVAGAGAGAEVLGQGLVRALWTDDEALSTRINPHVAHYTGQAELAEVIQDGLQARKEGDEDTATAKLGRAVSLASEAGHEETARLLAKVVEVVDATGTVRLKKRIADADEMALDSRSTKTVRTKK
ncbi:MAG: VWA domain-containing protein [Actinobacteria bacterium]|nr:VWA domain-containing protein [Actinomycetota bacterium]